VSLDLKTRPVRSPDEDGNTRDLGDELLAYDRANGRVHVLNATAREIHLLCDGSHTVEQIAGMLVEIYGIELDTALRDLTATIERFVELGLVEIRPARVP
jgi:PqqD family protein of HPr-rel-A system